MALLLFIIVPLGWTITGALLGPVIAQTFASERGRAVGRLVGFCCAGLFPAIVIGLFVVGLSGNAGHGVLLFGAEPPWEWLSLPVYAIPVLGGYALGVFVLRDIIRLVKASLS